MLSQEIVGPWSTQRSSLPLSLPMIRTVLLAAESTVDAISPLLRGLLTLWPLGGQTDGETRLIAEGCARRLVKPCSLVMKGPRFESVGPLCLIAGVSRVRRLIWQRARTPGEHQPNTLVKGSAPGSRSDGVYYRHFIARRTVWCGWPGTAADAGAFEVSALRSSRRGVLKETARRVDIT